MYNRSTVSSPIEIDPYLFSSYEQAVVGLVVILFWTNRPHPLTTGT